MNNKTVKNINLLVKLRGDNVYDLYLDGKWVASRGSCDGVLEEAAILLKESLNC